MITVRAALEDYRAEHVDFKVADWRRIEVIIGHLNNYFGDRALNQIGIPESRGYVSWRTLLGGISPGTIRRELGTLVAAANHARRWKRVTADQMPSVELPEAPPPKDFWLEKPQLAALAQAARYDLRLWAFIHLAYGTAGRASSIIDLEWGQVDMKRMRINLAKRGKAQTVKRRPVVPVTPEVFTVLQELQRVTGNTKYVLGHVKGVNYMLKELGKKVGIKNMTPHVLRHTRATHLLQDGISPWAVASLLGDNLTTVMKVYGHHCPDYLAETICGSVSRPNLSPSLASL